MNTKPHRIDTDRQQKSDDLGDHPTPSNDAPKVAARVTVNLSRKSQEALYDTAALTDDTKTEVINKALQVYREVRAAQEKGGGMWLQKDQASEPVLIRYY